MRTRCFFQQHSSLFACVTWPLEESFTEIEHGWCGDRCGNKYSHQPKRTLLGDHFIQPGIFFETYMQAHFRSLLLLEFFLFPLCFQLMVNCWFGLVVWNPRIPLWKGLLFGGTLIKSQTNNPNQQLTISWVSNCSEPPVFVLLRGTCCLNCSWTRRGPTTTMRCVWKWWKLL